MGETRRFRTFPFSPQSGEFRPTPDLWGEHRSVDGSCCRADRDFTAKPRLSLRGDIASRDRGESARVPRRLLRNWRGEFAAQYKRGRYFHMTLHPQHIGWSNRLQMLDEFLAELRDYPSLWNPTAAECARYWLDTYPAATHLHLEPSIWNDYPGSLS